jgi:hypothetical protein
MKSYLISYKIVRRSHPGIIKEDVLGLDGKLKFSSIPSLEEVNGLVLNTELTKDWKLVGLSISELGSDWLDDKNIEA